jgi:prepilin-type processing-associated H-X9-DG protein
MRVRAKRSGFTIVEAIVLVLVLVLIVALLVLILLPARSSHHHRGYRQLKDSTQVRGLIQAMATWAQNNGDQFPLPSVIDQKDATVGGPADSKDTTANILSLLVYNGYVPVEMLLSSAEANPRIQVIEGYQFENPGGAADPAGALWDPALSADFTTERGGHISYAHMIPRGTRMAQWANFTGVSAVLGNRGPEIASVSKQAGGTVTPMFANPASLTLLIHGSRSKWEGNIGYNDGHVEFVLDPVAGGKYRSTDGKQWPDAWCYDEPDDADGNNAFLGIFIKAGKGRKDFVAIWD